MNSSMISKIDKARRYAEEPDRAMVDQLHVQFRGDHDVYEVAFLNGHWTCSCHSYSALHNGTCSHIMALERLLGSVSPSEMTAPLSLV